MARILAYVRSVHCALCGSMRIGKATGDSDAENLPESRRATYFTATIGLHNDDYGAFYKAGCQDIASLASIPGLW